MKKAGERGDLNLINYFIDLPYPQNIYSLRSTLIGLAHCGDLDLFVSFLNSTNGLDVDKIAPVKAIPFRNGISSGSDVLMASLKHPDIFAYLIDNFENEIFYPHYIISELDVEMYFATIISDTQKLERLRISSEISSNEYMNSVFQVVPFIAIEADQIDVFRYLKRIGVDLISFDTIDSEVVTAALFGRIDIYQFLESNFNMTRREALFNIEGPILPRVIEHEQYEMAEYMINKYNLSKAEIYAQISPVYANTIKENVASLELIRQYCDIVPSRQIIQTLTELRNLFIDEYIELAVKKDLP